jgi:hypothetical protein
MSSVALASEPQTSNPIVHHRDTNGVTPEHTQKTSNNRTDVNNITNNDRNKDERKIEDKPTVQSNTDSPQSQSLIQMPTLPSQSAYEK